jgi:hypothetical protein
MGKWVGIAFIVLMIWIGMTVFTEGTDRAFGGLFAGQSSADAPPAEAPLDRIRRDAQTAREEQEQRIERQLQD